MSEEAADFGAISETVVFLSYLEDLKETRQAGKVTIMDFAATGTAHDVIEIDRSIFAELTAMLNDSAQMGADMVVTVDTSTSITLQHVNKAALNAGDLSHRSKRKAAAWDDAFLVSLIAA
jgi:hypothetical protein